MKKFGVGIIGLGRIYLRHLDDSIKQIPELKLVAICDTNKNLVEKTAKHEKVTAYTNYLDLIKDQAVDIVAVCTPNGLHVPMGMAAAAHNKHCVMEKPIALNYQSGKKLIDAFKKSRGVLFPVFQVRFNPAVRILEQYVKRGTLGKILTASLVIRWSRPQQYFDKSDWKGTIKMDGGSLLTQAIHYVDVLQLILGKTKSVFGKTDRVAHNVEVEDIANAIIDFESGTRANLEFTICCYPHNLECSITVLGEKGTIKIGGTAMNQCEIWEVKNTPKPYIPENVTSNIYTGGMAVGSSPNHKLVYQDMVEVLQHKKKSYLDLNNVLESLAIIDAIKKSSKLKREIKI